MSKLGNKDGKGYNKGILNEHTTPILGRTSTLCPEDLGDQGRNDDLSRLVLYTEKDDVERDLHLFMTEG